MRCAVCEFAVDTIDEIVEEGWIPHFFDGNQEHETACPSCAEQGWPAQRAYVPE
jgi:uncharacterized protein with PIN domain